MQLISGFQHFLIQNLKFERKFLFILVAKRLGGVVFAALEILEHGGAARNLELYLAREVAHDFFEVEGLYFALLALHPFFELVLCALSMHDLLF
jgi:hypothetical protein